MPDSLDPEVLYPFDLSPLDPLPEANPRPPELDPFFQEGRAYDLLQLIGRPDVPCARESAARLFAIPISVMDQVWADRGDEVLDCAFSCDCPNDTDTTGWSAEFAKKQHNISQSWQEARAACDAMSWVPHVVPYDGVLKVVTAASSQENQTGATDEWEWRLLVNEVLVASHEVVGISGRTQWNVPVEAGDLVTVDVRRKTEDDTINDALVIAYFDRT